MDKTAKQAMMIKLKYLDAGVFIRIYIGQINVLSVLQKSSMPLCKNVQSFPGLEMAGRCQLMALL